MEATAGGWRILDAALPALWREYSFGPGMATTLVIGLGPGKLLAVSPASGMDAAAHDALKSYGDVVALVAPNGLHHLGIEPWMKRWPNAVPYGAAASLSRLIRKCAAGASFRPLSQLALPEGVLIDNPPGLKSSDLVLRVRMRERWLWYINDLVMNMQRAPAQPMQRLVFGLLGMRIGLAAPPMPKLLLVRDRKATGEWLRREIDARPPALVVFGHGDPLAGPDVGERIKEALRERY